MRWLGCSRNGDEVPGMLQEQFRGAWDAPGAGMGHLGCSRSRDELPGMLWERAQGTWAPAWVRKRRGASARAPPALGRAVPGMQVSAPTAAPLVLSSFFLIMGLFSHSSRRARLPSTPREGEGVCVYYKFPIFLIKLYRYGGNQIPSSIFLA